MAHIVPVKTNAMTLGTLIVLTVITVYTAKYVDLGQFNLTLAMFIATCKALTVFLWFMHLKYDGNQNRAIIFSTLGFLALFIGFSALDLFTR
tara:strand:- start:114143 stop:114418 length:276 start_codon:yes stop_codon:yes gene_type:complete